MDYHHSEKPLRRIGEARAHQERNPLTRHIGSEGGPHRCLQIIMGVPIARGMVTAADLAACHSGAILYAERDERRLPLLRRTLAVRTFRWLLMKRVILFAPTALCAAICFQALVMAARAKISWSQTLFYAFLPACFLLAAGAGIRVAREVARLRRRVARLEAKAFPESRSSSPGSPGGTLRDPDTGSLEAADHPQADPDVHA